MAIAIGAAQLRYSARIQNSSRKEWTSASTVPCGRMLKDWSGLVLVAGSFEDPQRPAVPIAPQNSLRKPVPNTLSEMPQERRRVGVGSEAGRGSMPSSLRTGWWKILGFSHGRANRGWTRRRPRRDWVDSSKLTAAAAGQPNALAVRSYVVRRSHVR